MDKSATQIRCAATLLSLLMAAASVSAAQPAKQVAIITSDLQAYSKDRSLHIIRVQPAATSRRLLLSSRLLHQDTADSVLNQQQQSDNQPLAPAGVDPQAPTSNPASLSNPLSTSSNPSPAPVTFTPAANPPNLNPPAVPESPPTPTPGPTPAPPAVPEPAAVTASPAQEAPAVPEVKPPASPAASNSDTPTFTLSSTATNTVNPQSGTAVDLSTQSMSQQNASNSQIVAINSSSSSTVDDSSPALSNMVYVIMTLRGVTPDAFKSTYQGNVIGIVSQVSGIPEDIWNATLEQRQQSQQQQQQQLLMSHTQLAGSNTGNRRLLRQQRSVSNMSYDTGVPRRLLQLSTDQQGLQVTLSAHTSNPQLAVYRLSQLPVLSDTTATTAATTADNSGSSNFTGCTLELCSRLLAAGVPLDSTSMEVWPKYSFLSSSTGSSTDGSSIGGVTSDPGRDYQLAYARQLAIIIVASVAGFVVLLVLALNCGRLINCCVSCVSDGRTETLDSKVTLPVAQPISDKRVDSSTKCKQLVRSKNSSLIKSAIDHPLEQHSEGSASTASCSTLADSATDEIESCGVVCGMSGDVSNAVMPSFSSTEWMESSASPTHHVRNQSL